jgi:transposase
VESIQVEQDAVTFTVVSKLPAARCPTCGTASVRTHGGYHRRLADLPVAGRPVRIEHDQPVRRVDAYPLSGRYRREHPLPGPRRVRM